MSAAATGTAPRRILVRGPNWLGDVVMSTPGFRALRLAHPDARIVGLVPEHLAPVLAGGSDLDEVWTLPSKGIAPMRAATRRIAREGFDLGIVIQESISSALMMRWGRVAHVTGYARDALRRGLLHEVVSAPPEWGRRRLVSKERFVLGLMASVGASSSDTRLRLAITPDEVARFEALLATRQPRLELCDLEARKPIVIAPGASYGDSKCWPTEAYAEFADRMRARGECVVLIGTPAEADRIAAVRRAMRRRPIDLSGRLDLGTLKVLLRTAGLLVANDAGARHIASAFEVPSVIFFGPTSVAKTSDNLSKIEVLETEHDCRPCYRHHCPIDHRCLTTIGVDEAVAAADRRLRVPALRPSPQSSRSDGGTGERT
jgi:heptosyltransferase-2